MKKKKKSNIKAKRALLLVLAVIVILTIFVIRGCVGRGKTVTITGGALEYTIGKDEYSFSTQPIICGFPETDEQDCYFPVSDILATYEYNVSINSETGEVTASNEKKTVTMSVDSNKIKDKKNEYTYKLPLIKWAGELYISQEMMSYFTKDKFEFNGEYKYVEYPHRDLMEDTYIDDTYRLNGEVTTYNNVSVVDGKAMEVLGMPDSNCESYAKVINSLADALPDVQVYNIVVPSMTEFYGPEELYKDQISGIRKIYENLDEKVMPVNVVKEMWPHANEHLYFSTDHHWTQRGAYYAYRAFIALKSDEIADIDEFEQDNIEGFVGSWKRFMNGTPGADIMDNNPEELERFLPMVEYTGEVYLDMNLTDKWKDCEVIDLDIDQYTTFLGGDMPIIKFRTDVKNGEKLVIIKESFGNAFSTWAINNYEEVYIIDPRQWNGFNPSSDRGEFNLKTFYSEVCQFDDLIVISYPGSTTQGMRKAISNLVS